MKQTIRKTDILVLLGVFALAFLVMFGIQRISGRIDGVASMVFVLAAMTPVSASSCTVKVRLYSTLAKRITMTTTASSSHIAVVDMMYSLHFHKTHKTD